jgi:hypothetical protein
MSSLDLALQRALAVRLNLQISLSQMPIVEEWMDIHLDRWLEHNPMPHELPSGSSYLAMLGTDLKRVWWGAWGDPSGFIPKMADYFKLCNIARSDARALDQIGEHLEPRLVGSWIGVWGKKVTTGWHFMDPQPWSKIEDMFGTHEAKFTLKKWVEDHHVDHITRFSQSIGEEPYSEIELPIPGATVDDQVQAASLAFLHFTGAPIDLALVDRLRGVPTPELALAVRVRAGKIVRVGALAPGPMVDDVAGLCTDAKVACDPKLDTVIGSLAQKIARVEYGRAGERAGVDVYVEPGDPRSKQAAPPPSSAAN